MSEQITLRVGQNVPHFEMETYDPAAGDFGKFSLEASKQSGRWTVLVFYPADFTFVCPTELADLAALRAIEEAGIVTLKDGLQQVRDARLMLSVALSERTDLPPPAATDDAAMEALINSMTPAERRDPEILNGSRKRRITVGSGTDVQDLNRLLKQHKQMAKMMKKLKSFLKDSDLSFQMRKLRKLAKI